MVTTLSSQIWSFHIKLGSGSLGSCVKQRKVSGRALGWIGSWIAAAAAAAAAATAESGQEKHQELWRRQAQQKVVCPCCQQIIAYL